MKKIIICILVLILIGGSIFFVFNKNNSKQIVVGEDYITPLIESVSTRENVLLIEAGNFKYGDINQDGVIDEIDLLALHLIIKDELKHSDSQDTLSDLNKDKKIDSKDLDILVDYINDNETKYDYKNDLLYCVTTIEDTSNCNYQEDKYIKDIDYNINTYYISIKNSKTNKVGTYKYSYTNY